MVVRIEKPKVVDCQPLNGMCLGTVQLSDGLSGVDAQNNLTEPLKWAAVLRKSGAAIASEA